MGGGLAKSHGRRQRAFFDAFARLLPKRAARCSIYLFALLQVIAPTWHVCEMGGRCGHCKTETTISSEGDARRCVGSVCHCPPKIYPAGTVFADADNRPGKFKGTCLARELMGLPGVTLAPLQLIVRSVPQATPPARELSLPNCAPMPLLPARGPPVFSS